MSVMVGDGNVPEGESVEVGGLHRGGEGVGLDSRVYEGSEDERDEDEKQDCSDETPT